MDSRIIVAFLRVRSAPDETEKEGSGQKAGLVMELFRCKGCKKRTAVLENGQYRCPYCGKVSDVTKELGRFSEPPSPPAEPQPPAP